MSQQEKDETVMAERVGQLDEENKRLKESLEAARQEVSSLKRYSKAQHLFANGAWGLFTIFIIALIVSPMYMAITHPKVVSHCIVSSRSVATNEKNANGFYIATDSWDLTGVIEWGTDINLGYFMTIDDAVAASKKFNCPDINR